MHVQINPAEGLKVTPALKEHLHASLSRVERRFGDRITRVEAHFKDVNGPKGGVNKECMLEARVRGLDPLVAKAVHEGAYDAVKETAGKLEKVLEHRLGKLAQG